MFTTVHSIMNDTKEIKSLFDMIIATIDHRNDPALDTLEIGVLECCITNPEIIFNKHVDPEKIKQCRLDWDYISKNYQLDNDMYIEYEDYINWKIASEHYNLPTYIVIRNKDKVNWFYVSYKGIPKELLLEHSKELDWSRVPYNKMTEELLREHSEKLDWPRVSRVPYLSIEFIYDFGDNFNLDTICKRKQISIDNIIKYIHKINWNIISRYQELSIWFIGCYRNKINHINLLKNRLISDECKFKNVDWGYVVNRYGHLDKDLIPVDKLDFDYISMNYRFSVPFAKDFSHLINWSFVYKYNKNVSDTFIFKRADYIDWNVVIKTTPIPLNHIVFKIHKMDIDMICERQTLSTEFISEYRHKVNWDLIFKFQDLSHSFWKDKKIYEHLCSSDILRKYIDDANLQTL